MPGALQRLVPVLLVAIVAGCAIAGPALADTPTTPSTTPTTPTTPTTAATTTIPATPATTVDPAQLATLVQSLSIDLARVQAVNAYSSARSVASQAPTNLPAAPSPDAALIDAAAASLKATAIRDASAQRYNETRHRLSEVALTLYIDAGALNHGRPTTLDDAHRSAMLGMVLVDEKIQLDSAKRDLAATAAEVNRTQHDAQQLVDAHAASLQVAAQTAAMIAITASAPSAAVTRLRGGSTLPARVQALSPTILGPTVLSASELVGWFTASGHQPNLTVPLPTLVDAYESLGTIDGVRADVAFAQSALETGYFSFPTHGQLTAADNNFAGIGACDTCGTGRTFPDAHTGVAAQLQLLHGYATTQPLAGPMTTPAWVGGCCRTWMDLTGVWATAPDYGYRILQMYRGMVEWALAGRSAKVGL